MARVRRVAMMVGATVVTLLSTGSCSGEASPSPSVSLTPTSGNATTTQTGTSAPTGGGAVVTFEVAGRERYKIALTNPEDIEHARRLMAGENISAIPLGTVVRDDPGPNAPWSWHIDPATFSFAFATIEVCDGIPSDVEKKVVTSNEYCPWSAKVVAVTPAG